MDGGGGGELGELGGELQGELGGEGVLGGEAEGEDRKLLCSGGQGVEDGVEVVVEDGVHGGVGG